ncbi:MAG: PasA protein [Pseudomonas sp.]|nr:MAG: PasA protein [Pseudomonas sp.]
MAHELYTRTNQKIFFAGLALESLRKAEAGESVNALARVQAEREAVLFHLYGALLGLCHEIAGYYRLAGADAPRVDLFLDQAVLQASPTPELAELLELARQPQSWLALLLAEHAQLFRPPQAPKTAKLDPTLPLITTVSVEDKPVLPGHDELEGWRQQLKQLVLRFRESLSEC